MSKYRIVLDYGHGGSKPGAVCEGTEEKTVNYLTGQELNRHFRTLGGDRELQVLLTRDADYDIPLSTRCALINAHHAQEPIRLVLSVHYNAAGTPAYAGFETYHVATSQKSAGAAEKIVAAVGQANFTLRRKPVKTTEELGRRLAILHKVRPPAVLAEVGFLTNPIDRGNATDPQYRSEVARAMAQGVWNYLDHEGG
ncbi:MAG: N-acetylmuramoyl-L-alanine amidase [Fidelibacterota bacterium]|nr:MAG: N-acetylmuramoyl-L-alanine amidase [Candidatus Neomarinimicrobiota bacterium]